MRRQQGFTLIELIVVIMILGILATIAAPKFLRTSARAHDNATKQSLSVIRNAIELYTADHNGQLPGLGGIDGELEADLAEYLRGTTFPVSHPRGNALIAYDVVDEPVADLNTSEGWRYSTTSGRFIVNSTATLASDDQTTYDQL